MAAGDLTTLQHVKDWLAITDTGSDVLLGRLITSASRFVLGYIQRDALGQAVYNETYDGYGNTFMMLRQWPVLSIQSINFYGQSITLASTGNPRSDGYILDTLNSVTGGQQRLSLWGSCFPTDKNAINIIYTAGYMIVETDTVPATPGPYTVTPANVWLGDEGVTYQSGMPLVAVTGAPAPGQYSVSSSGVYTFNASDQGQIVIISYSYVPADIEQAVWEMVGERFRYKDRIGTNSKSLGGMETVSYSQKDMSDYIGTLLNPYRRVVPV